MKALSIGNKHLRASWPSKLAPKIMFRFVNYIFCRFCFLNIIQPFITRRLSNNKLSSPSDLDLRTNRTNVSNGTSIGAGRTIVSNNSEIHPQL